MVLIKNLCLFVYVLVGDVKLLMDRHAARSSHERMNRERLLMLLWDSRGQSGT